MGRGILVVLLVFGLGVCLVGGTLLYIPALRHRGGQGPGARGEGRGVSGEGPAASGEPLRRDDPSIDAADLAIDPALVYYRQAAEIATGFDEVRALAVGADDRVWVGGDRAVRRFGPDGARQAEIILGGAELPGPGGRGRSRFSSGENGTVPFNRRAHLRGPGRARGGVRSAGRAAGGLEDAGRAGDSYLPGHVRARRAGGRRRQPDRVALRRRGRILGRIGAASRARHIPGFLITSRDFDLAMGTDGLLYVVNPRALRVEGYTLAGDLERHWGQGSPALADFFGCCNPAHLAVLPDGRFVTAEKGIPRIKIYTAEGRFECVVAGPQQMAVTAAAVATDRRGRVYALDPATRSVRIFQRTNEIEHEGTKGTMVLRPSAAGLCASF